jgi:uncharacterized protein (DUF488 family)
MPSFGFPAGGMGLIKNAQSNILKTMAKFYSIGHSNLRLETFCAMLKETGIELLADVRAFPKSRSNPAYNVESFPFHLSRIGIDYQHMRSLGGRRSKQPGIEEHLNAGWRVRAFHNYADYALGDEFEAAFGQLIQFGGDRRLAIMCSEAVWWRCHRRIIVDYLLAKGLTADHIMPAGRLVTATMTPGASITSQGKVLYPAAT